MTTPLDDLLGDAGPMPPWRADGPVRFSVIVRTQGRRPGSLAEALSSLAVQSHPAHEVLVMVHDPEPATADEVRRGIEATFAEQPDELPWRTIAVRDGGRSRPLNAGLDAATGDYVCFLDDDDLARPNWLAAFDRAIQARPGAIARARTGVQAWATDGTGEPRRAVGPVEEPFAPLFDLLAHVSHNETPICAIAVPLAAARHHGVRFDENLPVFEDWDFLMHLAPLVGVESVNVPTSLYRRLDDANADTAESAAVWHQTHALVIDRLSARPLLLPAGDARRVASAHFVPGSGSRHEGELDQVRAERDRLTRSPLRWGRVFVGRAAGAVRDRIAGPH